MPVHHALLDLHDQIVPIIIRERTRISHNPSCRINAHPAHHHILNANGDLPPPSQRIPPHVAGDNPLLEPLEVEVATVAHDLRAVLAIANRKRVSARQVQYVAEYRCGPVRQTRGFDRRWSQEAFPVQSGEDFSGGREECPEP